MGAIWQGSPEQEPIVKSEPALQSKEQDRKPLTYSGARSISIPTYGSRQLEMPAIADDRSMTREVFKGPEF